MAALDDEAFAFAATGFFTAGLFTAGLFTAGLFAAGLFATGFFTAGLFAAGFRAVREGRLAAVFFAGMRLFPFLLLMRPGGPSPLVGAYHEGLPSARCCGKVIHTQHVVAESVRAWCR